MINSELLIQGLGWNSPFSPLKVHFMSLCPLLPASCGFPYAKASADSMEYLYAEKWGIYRHPSKLRTPRAVRKLQDYLISSEFFINCRNNILQILRLIYEERELNKKVLNDLKKKKGNVQKRFWKGLKYKMILLWERNQKKNSGGQAFNLQLCIWKCSSI